MKLQIFLGCVCLFLCLALHCDTSGPTRAVSDRPACSLVWQDDFDELSDRWAAADWTFAHNISDSNKEMIQLNNGVLELFIVKKEIRADSSDNPYWGAEIYTQEQYQHGVFTAVMKPYCPAGVVSSFLLRAIEHPVEQWLNSATIGIEFSATTKAIVYNVGWVENGALQSQRWPVDLDFDASKSWHQYSIEWTTNSIRFFIDTKLSFTVPDAAIIKKLQHRMSIHLDYWVSDDTDMVGGMDESKLPLRTMWDSVAWYKLVST